VDLVFVSRERNYFILIGLHLIRAHYETGGLKGEKKKSGKTGQAGGASRPSQFGGARCVYAICDVFYIINSAWWLLKGLVACGGGADTQTNNKHAYTHTQAARRKLEKESLFNTKVSFPLFISLNGVTQVRKMGWEKGEGDRENA